MTEGNGIGPLQIVRRFVNPNKDDLTFSIQIDPPEGADTFAFQSNVNAALDVIGAVAEREKWKADLSEKRKALRIAREEPNKIRQEIEQQRARRMAHMPAREAIHAVSGRRVPYKQSEADTKTLAQYDDSIAAMESAVKDFRLQVPIIEHEIAVLLAQIAGEEPPERPSEVEQAMAHLAAAIAA